MDFNSIRDFTWENLSRKDLGNNFGGIFSEIRAILENLGKLLLNFESIHRKLLSSDQNKITSIAHDLSILLRKIQNFQQNEGETMSKAIENSKILLEEVRDFYSLSLPIISALQVYIRDEVVTNIKNEAGIQKNEVRVALDNVQNTLQNKLSEIDKATISQTSDIQASINDSKLILQNGIAEINKQNQTQQQLTQSFIDTAKATLDPKLEQVREKLEKINETLKETEVLKNDVGNLVESTRSFSLTKVTTEYGKIFENEAGKNSKQASIFGAAFFSGILIALSVVYRMFFPLVKDFSEQIKSFTNLSQGIEYYILELVLRLTVISLIYWVLKELLKNYNVNSHLYNLNTHRSNSLRSFEIIVANNQLPENKDAIVKEIAQTIFAHQEDGFLVEKKTVPINDIANLISSLRKLG